MSRKGVPQPDLTTLLILIGSVLLIVLAIWLSFW